MAEIKKNLKQINVQSWSKEKEPLITVNMHHAHIKGLLLILVDSFSRCPEVIIVMDRKSTIVKQVLRIVFSRNGIPKTIITENTREFATRINVHN